MPEQQVGIPQFVSNKITSLVLENEQLILRCQKLLEENAQLQAQIVELLKPKEGAVPSNPDSQEKAPRVRNTRNTRNTRTKETEAIPEQNEKEG